MDKDKGRIKELEARIKEKYNILKFSKIRTK